MFYQRISKMQQSGITDQCFYRLHAELDYIRYVYTDFVYMYVSVASLYFGTLSIESVVKSGTFFVMCHYNSIVLIAS